MSSAAPDFKIISSLRYDPALLQNSDKNRLSSINSDDGSAFYMLSFHRDRMLSAARHFGWNTAATRLLHLDSLHEFLISEIETYQNQDNTKALLQDDSPKADSLKLRVSIDENGTLQVDISPTPAVAVDKLFPTAKFLDFSKQMSTMHPPDASELHPWRIMVDTQPTTPTSFTRFKTTSRNAYTAARERTGIPDFTSPMEVLLHNPAGEIMEGSLTSVYFFREERWVTPPLESGGHEGTTRRWLLEKGLCVEKVVKLRDVVSGEGVWLSNGVRGMIWGRISGEMDVLVGRC